MGNRTEVFVRGAGMVGTMPQISLDIVGGPDKHTLMLANSDGGDMKHTPFFTVKEPVPELLVPSAWYSNGKFATQRPVPALGELPRNAFAINYRLCVGFSGHEQSESDGSPWHDWNVEFWTRYSAWLKGTYSTQARKGKLHLQRFIVSYLFEVMPPRLPGFQWRKDMPAAFSRINVGFLNDKGIKDGILLWRRIRNERILSVQFDPGDETIPLSSLFKSEGKDDINWYRTVLIPRQQEPQEN